MRGVRHAALSGLMVVGWAQVGLAQSEGAAAPSTSAAAPSAEAAPSAAAPPASTAAPSDAEPASTAAAEGDAAATPSEPSEANLRHEDVTDPFDETAPPAAAAGAAAAGSAQASKKPPPAAEPRPDYAKLPQTYHLRHVDAALGVRISSATHNGLEPYLENPVTGEVVGRLSATVLAVEPMVLAVVIEGSGYKRESNAREVKTQLSMMDLGAGVEGRYHFHTRAFLYGRLMLGTELAQIQYGTEEGDGEYAKTSNWVFMGNAAVGAAVRLVGHPDGRKRLPRLWAFLEGGGRLTTAHQAELEVEGDGPNRAEPVSLPAFASNGVNGSAGLLVSF